VAVEPGLVGDAVSDPTVGEAACALLGENKPMTSMVDTTPMAMSSASPKDVPILVFMYSYSP
ncbi:uncharacterized protein METZ01_LOCUS32020, partial [marine metagenome]